MSNIKLEDLKEGMLVKLKTKDQLLETGWNLECSIYYHKESNCRIVYPMYNYLGGTCEIKEIDEDGTFYLKDAEEWLWDALMVHSIVSKECDIKVGDVVKLKSLEQLKEEGWNEFIQSYLKHNNSSIYISPNMFPFFGREFEVQEVYEAMGETLFSVVSEEQDEYYSWHFTPMMVDYAVEEYCNYSNEEPYYAVCEEQESVAWDKESIQRTFEELEMYDKGYMDGFKRAIELMKDKFGVEL